METQKNTSLGFFLFFISFLLCMTASAANDPGNGGGFSHEQHFINNPYTGTVSCLGSGCHDKEAADVLTTGHWKWQGVAENVVGVENEIHGKNDFINNFCVSVPTNEGRCAQCHIGYGYTDKDFDFSNAESIDCLICHDQTDTYVKGKTNGGLPIIPLVSDTEPDLQAVAMSVADNGGVPGRQNCIVCHANAGGGDNIKHGDLSMSIASTTREFDVHMGTDGGDMSCVDCHDVDRTTGGKVASHGIGGMPYHSVDEGIMKQCVDCHADSPAPVHSGEIASMIATHDRLTCQVCHIPAIARNTSTKTEWYWSTAGDFERVPVLDEDGRPDYDLKKGDFVWTKNVRPTLRFFNGKWNKMMINVNDIVGETEEIEDQPVDLGSPVGDRSDPDAMIYPFKKMIGNQVAGENEDDEDNEYYTMLVPHLFKKTDDLPNPYWGVYDWDLALQDAAGYTGQFYSGYFEFVDTVMLLTVNHEIAPKENSLGMNNDCSDCHAEGLIDWPALGLAEDPYTIPEDAPVIDKASWGDMANPFKGKLKVEGEAGPRDRVRIVNGVTGERIFTVRADRDGDFEGARNVRDEDAPCTVAAVVDGFYSASVAVEDVPEECVGKP
ncbi:MAG: tetrathionate reductase family octaheme c-type cytochrome [Gammaproteobacteria bacterium]|nr:tetrathionate reductase family octaheme c-type cytochrome [Gammaproteobacteria bacterium]